MDIEKQISILASRTVDLHSVDELRKKLTKAAEENRPLRVKYGADPSAPDIHLGHVVGLNKLREFQDLGHTVVFIIGDFTGMIGDPSGRSQTRKPLTREEVAANARSYQEQVFKVLDPERTEVRFNAEWCAPLSFADVIRLSSHVTVAQMLARDDFSNRYSKQQPISLVEFLYPLVQAFDSVEIKADVELGGTDQLFNLMLGRELQKVHEQEPQVVMTLPIIEGLDGVQKMSKSLNNYIGVNESPKEMFGKTMSVSDELMWRYFTYICACPDEEVAALKTAVEQGERHPRDVKDELGQRIVARFHDEAAAKHASDEFKKVFSGNQLPEDMPEVTFTAADLNDGSIGLLSLVVRAGLAASNGEARRLVQQGGVRIDDEKMGDVRAQILLKPEQILRVGKRGFAKVFLG